MPWSARRSCSRASRRACGGHGCGGGQSQQPRFWTLLRASQVVLVVQVVVGRRAAGVRQGAGVACTSSTGCCRSGRRSSPSSCALVAADQVLMKRGVGFHRRDATGCPKSEQQRIVLEIVQRETGVMAASALVVFVLALRASRRRRPALSGRSAARTAPSTSCLPVAEPDLVLPGRQPHGHRPSRPARRVEIRPPLPVPRRITSDVASTPVVAQHQPQRPVRDRQVLRRVAVVGDARSHRAAPSSRAGRPSSQPARSAAAAMRRSSRRMAAAHCSVCSAPP